MLTGYDYTFLSNRGKGADGRGFLAYNCPDIANKLGRENFDALLIPAYNSLYYLQALRSARKRGIKVFLRGNNLDGTNISRPRWKTNIRKAILKRFYKSFEGFFSIGGYMRRHYLEHDVPQTRIFNTPYCIDSELFEKQREMHMHHRDELRREIGVPQEALVLIYSGRFIPWKNTQLIAEALGMIEDRKELFFIGMGDGSERSSLEYAMREMLGARALFPGFVNQSELGRYYSIADILILPSKRGHETWGLVVNEAMTFGLPVIVSDGVGCREDLVHEGKTGFVFHNGQAKQMAGYVRRFLEHPRLRHTMGNGARELIVGYSVQVNATRIAEALKITTTMEYKGRIRDNG